MSPLQRWALLLFLMNESEVPVSLLEEPHTTLQPAIVILSEGPLTTRLYTVRTIKPGPSTLPVNRLVSTHVMGSTICLPMDGCTANWNWPSSIHKQYIPSYFPGLTRFREMIKTIHPSWVEMEHPRTYNKGNLTAQFCQTVFLRLWVRNLNWQGNSPSKTPKRRNSFPVLLREYSSKFPLNKVIKEFQPKKSHSHSQWQAWILGVPYIQE